jgi:hypothetical protein
MEILIRLELDGDIRNEDAIRECVYAYLFELIEDDSLDYEIKGADELTSDIVCCWERLRSRGRSLKETT